MPETPDLVDELAKAVKITTKELNALDDLAEQLQGAAARATRGRLTPEAAQEIRASCDRLAEWQLQSVRDQARHMRARVMGRYKELAC